ncbi:hypothetical protein VNI00_002700 [Paramarasmius palmivorus]|uniref:PDZ GRASP-type domain-containing protein n=1 Tax=Paramarasmius palmivorus TaxID=297713 RepID=A0AAW0DYZ6_9AGAR
MKAGSALREVVLVPNRHWGGEGLLGCVFGYGLLHRIPPQNGDRVPGSTPPELADELEEQELFVPADVHAESEYSPTQLEEWRRQEQEQWNHESTEARFMYEAKAPGADHDTISPIGEEDGAQTPVDERRRSPEQPSFIAQDTPRNTPPRQASIPAQSHLSRNFLGTTMDSSYKS